MRLYLFCVSLVRFRRVLSNVFQFLQFDAFLRESRLISMVLTQLRAFVQFGGCFGEVLW